jgi:hypothetical protein
MHPKFAVDQLVNTSFSLPCKGLRKLLCKFELDLVVPEKIAPTYIFWRKVLSFMTFTVYIQF